ncbi:MAG: type II toxin-antitoxin system HicB family antitoxin [Brevinematales bacterium]|nr:type II toxin-antitoxin system HicB family antitoxin [Brevinematales bacterium]
MNYHFRIHKESDGLWAECIELEGCVTQSEKGTMDDLLNNMTIALNLYLDEPDYDMRFPSPDKNLAGDDIVEVPVEPGIAFALLIREKRHERNLTQKEMAKRLGFSNLWSYQRLEAPRKNNPKLTTIAKIKKEIPELDFNLIFQD